MFSILIYNLTYFILIIFCSFILGIIWSFNKKVCFFLILIGITTIIITLFLFLTNTATNATFIKEWYYYIGNFIAGLLAINIFKSGKYFYHNTFRRNTT